MWWVCAAWWHRHCKGREERLAQSQFSERFRGHRRHKGQHWASVPINCLLCWYSYSGSKRCCVFSKEILILSTISTSNVSFKSLLLLKILCYYCELQTGGPYWSVPLGRRDGTTASESAANEQIPGPSDSLQNITARFTSKGLNSKDVVVLSGTLIVRKDR